MLFFHARLRLPSVSSIRVRVFQEKNDRLISIEFTQASCKHAFKRAYYWDTKLWMTWTIPKACRGKSREHLSFERPMESALLEYLLQQLKDVEVVSGKMRYVDRMVQCLPPQVLYLGLDGVCCVRECLIVQENNFQESSFLHTSIAVYGRHPPMNLRWLTNLCAQNLDHNTLILSGRMQSVVQTATPRAIEQSLWRSSHN